VFWSGLAYRRFPIPVTGLKFSIVILILGYSLTILAKEPGVKKCYIPDNNVGNITSCAFDYRLDHLLIYPQLKSCELECYRIVLTLTAFMPFLPRSCSNSTLSFSRILSTSPDE
jgi:hypothetical protein